jgi:hypothetical protein
MGGSPFAITPPLMKRGRLDDVPGEHTGRAENAFIICVIFLRQIELGFIPPFVSLSVLVGQEGIEYATISRIG